MKLVSLKIWPDGDNGWTSREHVFGKRVTQLFAKNGSGKTPLVKSIVYALGGKVEFRRDVRDRCARVTLAVESGGDRLILERSFKRSNDLAIITADGGRLEFSSEREYSRFLFDRWGIQDPVLTSVSNQKAQLYSSQLLPLFYLEQGSGYTSEYHSTQRFIKDQYAEVMRLVFGIAPKNSFDRKRARIELKEKEERLHRVIARSERLMEELAGDLRAPRRSLEELASELEIAVAGLEGLRNSEASAQRVDSELDSQLGQLQRMERELLRERVTLNARVRSLAQIRQEIEIEANTLSLNEEARRVFSSFDVICAKEGCGLFVRSSESYGKSLLYLKDQIKDLVRVSNSLEKRTSVVSAELEALGAEIADLNERRLKASTLSETSAVVDLTQQLTERVIELKRSFHIESELKRLETEYVGFLEQRAQVQSNLAGLEDGGALAGIDLLTLRNALRGRIIHWLNVLRTRNVDRSVEVGPDFKVSFGGESSTSIDSSSTQTRVILAMRTAAFELAVQRNRKLPRFFILDTPRQQDIAREDLAEYMRAVFDMAGELGAQVVCSTTNQRYELGSNDVEWQPDFPGVEQPMFLGTADNE